MNSILNLNLKLRLVGFAGAHHNGVTLIRSGLAIDGRRCLSSARATATATKDERDDVNKPNDRHAKLGDSATTHEPSIDSSSYSTYGHTGSAKLFADAELEESRSASAISTSRESVRVSQLIQEHTSGPGGGENWTGEERIQDTVLRMLVDKYKPLRGPVIRSAEEKMRAAPPSLSVRTTPLEPESQAGLDSDSEYKPDWEKRKDERLLPSVEGHRPWNTTFTPPSTLTARVKFGALHPPPRSARARGPEEGSKAKVDIAAARRSATAQRLGRARESMLDYKLGLSSSTSAQTQIHTDQQHQQQRRPPPPVTLRAWSSLIEERIERARHNGAFSSIKGRGEPLKRENAEHNPFIAREEFLMNRIVQRNQAAPAWVELQGEVDSAIRSFRAILRQSWTRRAILSLTSFSSPSSLHSLTLSSVRAHRDASWVQKESAYHATALAEVNELVRRYNGVAPYAVRKPYFVHEAELERCYWESGEDVFEGVRERIRGAGMRRKTALVGDEESGAGDGGGAANEEKGIGVWETIRAWIASLRSRA